MRSGHALVRILPSIRTPCAGFFSFFNQAQFNNPTGNFSSSHFGYVTSARDPRIGQMSLKFFW
jgi:hypothetical protein